jgi:hypothetical protein
VVTKLIPRSRPGLITPTGTFEDRDDSQNVSEWVANPVALRDWDWDWNRDEREIERFLDYKFPLIQRLAEKMQADIGFEDESGIGIMTRYGKTWGLRGETPVIPSSTKRGGYNVMSIVTAEGKMQFSIKDQTINSEVFIEFMKHLIDKRERPLIMLVDHASFHHSKAVREFVGQHRLNSEFSFCPSMYRK